MGGVGNGNGERLDSWKAIAAYLGRDAGTVRRWERTRGLPVHRVPGGKGSSVFAYKSEIDAWLESAPQETPDAGAAGATGATGATGARWKWAVASATIGAVLLLGWMMQRPSARVSDLHVEISATGLIGKSADGRELWSHRLADTGKHALVETAERMRVMGGRTPAIYFTTSHQLLRADDSIAGGQFTSLGLDGRVRWSYTFDDTLTVGGKPYAAPWAVTAFAPRDAGPRRQFASAAHHWMWGPSVVALMDDTGRRVGSYVNHGWIEQLQWVGEDRLAIGGFSQSKDGGLVALLDTTRHNGQSPEPEEKDRCQSCGSDLPLRMAVMPRTELNLVTHSRFNRAILERAGDRLIVRTVEVPPLGQGVADVIYEFTPGLEFVQATFSQRYWEVHDQLSEEKKLDHDRAHCPDRDGPPPIHLWSPEAGWQTRKRSGP